ncbi:hypothetical protein Vafri_19500, partial [Volvox africanus]
MRRRGQALEWLVIMLLSSPFTLCAPYVDPSNRDSIANGVKGGLLRNSQEAHGRRLALQLPIQNNTEYDGLVNSFVISPAKSITISNVTFKNCRNGALALAIDTTSSFNIVIKDCSFSDNTKPLSISLNGTTYTGSITIENCTFNSNAVALSVSVSSSDSIDITIRNCNFFNNSNSVSSAGSSSSSSSLTGAAVILSGTATITILNCNFQNNTAQSGAAVYSTVGSESTGSLEIANCLFNGNRGQGAVFVDNGILYSVANSNFTYNTGGSALYMSELASVNQRSLSIDKTVFSDNSADGTTNSTTTDFSSKGGGILLHKCVTSVSITNCTFTRNTAKNQGGGLVVSKAGSDVLLTSVIFSNNEGGLYGGAMVVSTSSTVIATDCNFTANRATQGGAILVSTISTLGLSACRLENNTADKFGGGISGTTTAVISISNTTFLRNKATYGGALECWSCDYVYANSNYFLNNSASGSAGALGLYSASSTVSVKKNVFKGNSAAGNTSSFTAKDCSRSTTGAGGAVCASITVAMDVSGNIFDGNQATSGGAMFVTRQCAIMADDSTCATARLNLDGDNILNNNIAQGGGGGAIYTLNVTDIAITCSGSSTVYTGSVLSAWPYGASGCPNWSGNQATAGGYGSGLATGLAGLRELPDNGTSRSNLNSNSAVTVVLVLYDFLGTTITKGTYEATGTTAALWMTGELLNYVISGYSNTSDNGVVTFNTLKMKAPAGTYNMTIYALPTGITDITLYKWANISFVIRPCKLGEILDSGGDLCNECSGTSYYTFSTFNTSCDSCPSYALCSFNGSYTNTSDDSAGYLVPEDGYWHSSPFSPQMLECPYSAACTFDDRNVTIGTYQEDYLSGADTTLPTPDTSVLYNITTYWQLQCKTGYKGRLCAQCEGPEYGWRSSGRCYKCPARILNALFYILSYLFTIVLLALTVRATLGRNSGESRALVRAVRNSTRLSGARSRTNDGEVADGDDEDEEKEKRERERNDVAAVSFKIRDTAREGNGLNGGGGGGDGGRRVAGLGSFHGFPATESSIEDGSGGGSGGGGKGRGMDRSGSGSGSGSKRGSFAADGGSMKRRSQSANVSGDGQGGSSSGRGSRKGRAAGILEMAAAAAMAQLEEEAARKGGTRGDVSGSGGRHDDDDDNDYHPYGSVDGGRGGVKSHNGGAGYDSFGGFGGRMAGGQFAGAMVVDPREGSVAQLPPAVLPGMRPNIRGRVPRSVRARESRLAQSSGPGGDGNMAIRVSEGSDGSDSEQRRRHRLARMSRAEGQGGGGSGSDGSGSSSGGGGSSAGGAGGGGGSGSYAASPAKTFGEPVAEGLTTWFDGMRRRRGGNDSEVVVGSGDGGGGIDDGKTMLSGRHGGGGASGPFFDSVGTMQREQSELRAQLKEDELDREDKPPHAVVLKILVNFLQVTTVARNLDLNFPDFVTKMWNVGSMASSAMTTLVSIDCSFPENIPKAIQRTVLYVAVPWLFILAALPIWILLYMRHLRRRRKAVPELLAAAAVTTAPPAPPAAPDIGNKGYEVVMSPVVSFKKISGKAGQDELATAATTTAAVTDTASRDGSGGGGYQLEGEGAVSTSEGGSSETFNMYLTTRMIVTTLTVIFYFYPVVTDTVLYIYQCEELDVATGPYAAYLQSVGYFWELDYDLRCFHGSHLVLTLVVAVPWLLLWCVGVPLGSALWLRYNAARGKLNQPQFSDRYGFLYEDYRRTRYYWESVIMARKLLVVGVMLATNSADDITQVLAVMGVVVIAGLLQLYVRPYALDRFNTLENTSLASTLLILYLCCFFLMSDITDTTQKVISVLILGVNAATIGWFVYCLAIEAYRYGVQMLDSDGDGRVSKEEVNEWLRLTLGKPVARVVAFVAARQLRPKVQPPGDGSNGGAVSVAWRPGTEIGMAPTATAPISPSSQPPPPLVVLGQPSPSAPSLPPPFAAVPSAAPPMLPQQQPWISGPTVATQARVSPPSLQLPQPSTLPPPPPPPAPTQVVVLQSDEPADSSFTVVTYMQSPQDILPVDSIPASPPSGDSAIAATSPKAAGGNANGNGSGLYSARRSSGANPDVSTAASCRQVSNGTAYGVLAPGSGAAVPAATICSGTSNAERIGSIEAGGLQGRTASGQGDRSPTPSGAAAAAVAAALLAAPGSLPGSPLESGKGNMAGSISACSSAAAAGAGVSSEAGAAAAGSGSRRLSRQGMGSFSGDSGGEMG